MASGPGKKHKSRRVDWRSEVRKVENLKEPTLEYRFSNRREFKRPVTSTSGIYE